MLDIIKRLLVMIDEEIAVLIKNKCEKDEYISNIKSVGGDVLIDKDVLQQINKAENWKIECEGQLVELYDYRHSLAELNGIALQSHCTKDNQTFSGFVAQMGPPPKKYDMFRKLFNGENWWERMNKMPVNQWWDKLELIMERGATNE